MTRALQIQIVHFRRKKLLRLKLIQLKRNLLEIIKIFAENYVRYGLPSHWRKFCKKKTIFMEDVL